MTIRNLSVVASLGLAGCAGGGGDAGVIEQPVLVAPKCQGYQCPKFVEAAVGPYYVGAMASDGSANDNGVAIVEAVLGEPDPRVLAGGKIAAATAASGVPVALQVSGDRLYAIELVAPFSVLSGQALQGLTIWMTSTSKELFELVVDRVSLQDLHFWEGEPGAVEGYELTWQRVDPPDPKGVPTFVCSGDGTVGDPLWGGVPHAAMIYEGDYFDPGSITVASPASPAQFNLACPGSRRAQMQLARHTAASDHDGRFPTGHDQRQALLKMLSADYCGDGRPFTFDNVPVAWLDNTGWDQPSLDLDPQHGQIRSIEAIWGPNGAVCLDVPRMVPRSKVGCALPTCQDLAGWAQQGHIISANPALP